MRKERLRKDKTAIVLVSGGLDSATTLAVALEQGYQCYALCFDYGQRHRSELAAAASVISAQGVTVQKTMRLFLDEIGGSALTDKHIDIPETSSDGVPATYVPARNTIFLSYALAWAEAATIYDIFIGVNTVDYSGYPDCRAEYIKAFEQVAYLGTKSGIENRRFHIHTPLISLNKAEIIRLGTALGVDYTLTVSCYQADTNGLACNRCEACQFRRAGFAAAGISDPTRYK